MHLDPEKRPKFQSIWAYSLIIVLSVVASLYLINIFSGIENFSTLISLPAYTIITSILVIVSLYAIIQSNKIKTISKKPLFFLTCSFVLWFAAELTWNIYLHILDIDPYPSPADFFYISALVSMFIALTLFLKSQNYKISRNKLIFSMIIPLVILIPSLIITYQVSMNDNQFEIFVALIYPIGDSVLLIPTILIISFLAKEQKNFFWMMLLAGIIGFVAADTIFLFLIIDDSYVDGHPVDVLWLSSYLIWTFAIVYLIYNIRQQKNYTSDLSHVFNYYDIGKSNHIGIIVILTIVNISIIIPMVSITFYFSDGSDLFLQTFSFILISAIIFFSSIIAFLNFKLNSKLRNDTENLIDSTDIESQMIIQKNLRRALDESSMVAITDKNGLIKYVNKQFCETTEYSSDELIGKNHDLIRSGYHSIEFYDNLWNIINSGKVWHGEVKNISKTGKIFWCDLIIVPFLDKYGDVHEHIAIRRNITKQKKFYEDNLKNEKMITVGRFSARLAHDLRNPLSIIQVSLENLRLLYGTNESQQKSMDKVERSIDRITHQVDDVLDFVRERPITLNNHTMSEIISESLDSLPIPDNIKLILPKNNVEVYCDEKQFAIVFNNLILNGVQAIVHTGTIEITVEENNDGIIIQIMDSGEGIPKENIDSLFEPLFTTKQQGTGLGLASVKSIVEAHGGIISVSSPPTVFTITLPKISDN